MREKKNVKANEVIFQGFGGIYCVEAGRPAPGVGCGIITSLELLQQLRVFEELDLDIVIYDVFDDVVCGALAVPVREGIAEHVFSVCSSDFMAICAANKLFKGIRMYANKGGSLLGGVIANSMNSQYQRGIVDDFADNTHSQVVAYVPRSVVVTQAELQGKTTIEAFPNSDQAQVYKALAEKIYNHTHSKVPTPLNDKHLHQWAFRWADTLLAIETGEVRSRGGGQRGQRDVREILRNFLQ